MPEESLPAEHELKAQIYSCSPTTGLCFGVVDPDAELLRIMASYCKARARMVVTVDTSTPD